MWKLLEKPKTVIASHALVKEFSEMEPVPHDRPLRELRVQVYRRILESGEFRSVTWASAYCAETGCTYRVNGKHTSLMLSTMNPLPEFHVTVERYQVDTLQELGKLYNTFDSNLSSRTTGDINKAFAATIPDLKNLPINTINRCVAALAAAKWPEDQLRKIPPAERAEELVDNQDFVTWVACIIPGGGGGSKGTDTKNANVAPINRVPVITAMLATYRKNKQQADEFWLKVRDETAPDRNDPTRTLARYLSRAQLGSRGIRGDKQQTDNREMYAKCIHAWNAWRRGESTTLSYHRNAELPSAK